MAFERGTVVAEPSRTAVDVAPEVVIRRPRAAVAAYMFDPRNDAEWTANVKEVRPRQEGRLSVGSRVERVVRFLGREFGYEYEVLAAEGDRFVMLRVEQPFPMRVRYELEDEGDGATRARIRATGDPGGFFRIAAPLMRLMVRRSIRRDLGALKRNVEARAG